MRQNGLGTLTLEDARTWIEETGLCLFLPRRQFSTSVAPSFVEAVAGRPEATPDPKTIAHAEELLIRLENEGVAVRLNLQGQPGEQPDFSLPRGFYRTCMLCGAIATGAAVRN